MGVAEGDKKAGFECDETLKTGLGAGEGVRTLNIQLGRLALCQLSYPRDLPPNYSRDVCRLSIGLHT